jgi:hypothetical protein
MRVFAIGIEHALDVAVQRSHDTDPREHRRAAGRRRQDQRLHRRPAITAGIHPASRALVLGYGLFRWNETASSSLFILEFRW